MGRKRQVQVFGGGLSFTGVFVANLGPLLSNKWHLYTISAITRTEQTFT
jgi:hypothetical protein